jgi:hypothetical protein
VAAQFAASQEGLGSMSDADETTMLDKPSTPVKCNSSPLVMQTKAKNIKQIALPPQQQ